MIREEAAGMAEIRREDSAYRSGWEDGRFGPPETFVSNANLDIWTEYLDRLAYYRGHRDGRRVREMYGSARRPSDQLAGSLPAAPSFSSSL